MSVHFVMPRWIITGTNYPSFGTIYALSWTLGLFTGFLQSIWWLDPNYTSGYPFQMSLWRFRDADSIKLIGNHMEKAHHPILKLLVLLVKWTLVLKRVEWQYRDFPAVKVV